ncbi:hypothetical protein C2S52_011099 [Perilla frutescens var. hirtella]|nr:hypothetical protein C2S52_011099 [Perilla frutescens var. hirtella]KAH6817896.1 hypothetical protein C2S51_001499 [Perilla frutescens var. frutescens]
MRNMSLGALFLALIFSPHFLDARHQACKPSGKVKGKKPPPDHCNEDDNICCIEGKYYTTYKCSPSVSASTKGVLYLTGFEKGGDGYKPSKCDNKYHSDDTPVVSLPSGWYNGGRRCLNNITISGNGRSVEAVVVDVCDSSMGCDADHDYLPPCANNVVGASEAVWKVLGVPLKDWGELDITWSDA